MAARSIIITVAMACATVCAKAGTNDTLTITGPQKVMVANTPNGYTITASSIDSTYRYERIFNADGTTSVRKAKVENKQPGIVKAVKKMTGKFNPHWCGMEFGWVASTGTNTGGLNGAEGAKGKLWKSWEVALNLMEYGLPIGHKGFGAFTGLGVDWREIRLKGDNIFYKDPATGTTSIVGKPEGIDLKNSRVHMFSITVPLMVEWQTPKSKGDDFWINAGAVVNFNPYTTYGTKWREGSVKCEDKTYKTKQQPVTIDMKLAFGAGAMGFFVKYSPMKVIRSGYGPDFCPLSFGLAVH